MINSVCLKNFRQHRDLSINFNEGVTVIRGLNEAGKSTVFEAITFAFFGIRACRNNDVTTWGEPANSHSVTLTFAAGPVTYNLKRSTRGAEITWDGGRVTGQTEVTRFCEEVLELKPNTGSKLMFVGQNAMRGVLEEGGAKTAQMIEQLADFDQIETWIAKLQELFPTGNTNILETTLNGLSLQIKEAERELSALPDPTVRSESLRKDLEGSVTKLTTNLSETEAAYGTVNTQLQKSLKVEEQRRVLQRELDITDSDIQSVEKQMNERRIVFSEKELEDANNRIELMLDQRESYTDYADLSDKQYNKAVCTLDRIEGTETVLREKLAELMSLRDEAIAKRYEIKSEISHLKKHLNTEFQCPTCNREWDNVAQMKDANLKTEVGITVLEAQVPGLCTRIDGYTEQIDKLQDLLSYTAPVLRSHTRWQPVKDGFFPPVYRWEGDIPEPVLLDEIDEVRHRYTRLEALRGAFEDQQRRLQDAGSRLQDLRRQSEDLRQQLDSLEQVTPSNNLQPKKYELEARLNDMRQRLSDVQHKLADFESLVKPWFDEYDRWSGRVSSYKEEMENLLATLSETKTNNSLLKALRTLKPKVADKMWNTVCAAVSHYFSLMRGSQSTVLKNDNGFTVDGKDVNSLSGSTLDILGIAIRVALTKTFMPSCRFLFLDEPFAACDMERQTQALGFVTSVGFQQVIIVTHEDTTEAVADHLVAL